MSKTFEQQYVDLVYNVLAYGDSRAGRNGNTRSIFHSTLVFDLSNHKFPMITGRQMYPKGILGEYAAIIRGPKTIEDFKIFGCNYWDTWVRDNGTINIDYGNKWNDFNGFLQLDWLLNEIQNNPTSRRLLLSGWDPANQANLDLPCCHYMYQFYVRFNPLTSEPEYLDMIWHQRSADLMVGVPSDAVFAAAMLLSFAGATNLKAGKVTMVLGDTHIYEEHIDNAHLYLSRPIYDEPEYVFRSRMHPRLFLPRDLTIAKYKHAGTLKFELKA